MRLKGKTAVITGANAGIGRAAVLRFASEGADIVGVDICTDGMESLEKEVTDLGSSFLGLSCDVREAAAVKETLAKAKERFGRIDIVLNIAGVSTSLPLSKVEEAEFERVMDINVKGVFHFSKYASVYMREQKGGVIINTASVSGLYGSGLGSPYASSKGAIIAMTKSLGFELAPFHIRVNAVAPGVVQTGMVADLGPREKKSFSRTIPLGRLGKPEDIAAAMAFLASDDAAYITSTIINVDGGYRPANV